MSISNKLFHLSCQLLALFRDKKSLKKISLVLTALCSIILTSCDIEPEFENESGPISKKIFLAMTEENKTQIDFNDYTSFQWDEFFNFYEEWAEGVDRAKSFCDKHQLSIAECQDKLPKVADLETMSIWVFMNKGSIVYAEAHQIHHGDILNSAPITNLNSQFYVTQSYYLTHLVSPVSEKLKTEIEQGGVEINLKQLTLFEWDFLIIFEDDADSDRLCEEYIISQRNCSTKLPPSKYGKYRFWFIIDNTGRIHNNSKNNWIEHFEAVTLLNTTINYNSLPIYADNAVFTIETVNSENDGDRIILTHSLD